MPVKTERVDSHLMAMANAITVTPSAAPSVTPLAAPTATMAELPIGLEAVDLSLRVGDGVVVDAIADGDPQALLADLQAMGLRNGTVYGNVVSGILPLNAVASMHTVETLSFVSAAAAQTNVGLVTSEAFEGLEVDEVSGIGLDGDGQKVGILSDSFDCGASGGLPGVPFPNRYADDIASGDLPPDVEILEDFTCGIDEGRGMAQLVHDLVPAADLAFHTAFTGQAGFAQGIIDLADVGSTVIVDDIIYFAEPMFADGIIAQAADEVYNRGIPYYSSAGNRANASYESVYRPSGVFEPFFGGEFHDFDPGPGVDVLQEFTLQPGENFIASFQWVDAYASTNPASPGAQTDMDIWLLIDGAFLPFSFQGIDLNIGADPIELAGVSVSAPLTLQFAITKAAGPDPELIKYVNFGSSAANATIQWFNFAPSSFGHNNAFGATSTGAAFWGTTPAFEDGWEGFPNGFADYIADPRFGPTGGSTNLTPPLINSFSSYGGVPIFFDIFGNRLPVPELRPKPEITAIDGTNTTFFIGDTGRDADTFPNFFGTSAAAPHAAAVAALMLQANPNLTAAQVEQVLQATAIDIQGTNDVGRFPGNDYIPLPAGFDNASGAGLIQADAAIAATISSPELVCNGLPATIYVQNGVIIGGPQDGQPYAGNIQGTNGPDVIVGTNANENINGGNAPDVICAFDGDDYVLGANGDDVLFGGDGADSLVGANGHDQLFGETGMDDLRGGNGSDLLDGGDGMDGCDGGLGDDTGVNCEMVIDVE